MIEKIRRLTGRRRSDAKVVEYSCNPKYEGVLYIAFAVVFLLFGLIRMMCRGGSVSSLVIFGLAALAMLIIGVYMLKFRKRPLRRVVVVDTWMHRLYKKSKWKFAVTTTVVYLLLTLLLSVVLLLIDGEKSVTWQNIVDKVWKHGVILLALLYCCVSEVAGFYFYERSPEDSRTVI
ncbi:MAG: hypothetical protein J6C66_01560 [Prevotella sp.]|nr:hypothetical protein [Prevotella sp.]